ncbi:lysozyme inhibitor LprI family protein [Sulfitobacter faviae]|uniref:Lysozyme inhibitor LprI family protein n=1 Tax=Sulfitobacter faviae TaxID=1775881 RepID=A0ABZ0V301_9RHOB|nr:lysozyme inhibitor LprI family protein [Sulfitobacter faviae]WPZ23273.1 lysozyme inhibitor LprI family protein [Sulfitobacter faviae]
MRTLLLACAFLAGPVSAQDIVYSDAATADCLAGAEEFTDQRACIGLSANLCMEGPGGYSTVGMGGCLDAELTFWDGLLNENYRARMVQAKSADEENALYQPQLPSQAEALRDMQRAWITFRDAACDYERSQWGGGTGGGPATLACLMQMTGEQALRLGAAY